MPRQPRVRFPGALYHVMVRGNAKQKIFLSDDDRSDFMDFIARVTGACSWACHAYCLMDNHYHLLVETPKANISEGMQRLNSCYCQCFNRRHGRVGHVTQGRFHSLLVADEGYLLELFRYILLNPVKERLVGAPERWKWSSYAATAGIISAPPFLDVSYALSFFSDDPAGAREAFVRFIAEGLDEVNGERGRGLLVKSIFQDMNDKQQRINAIRRARLEHDFSVPEIAVYLEIHTATVYRALK